MIIDVFRDFVSHELILGYSQCNNSVWIPNWLVLIVIAVGADP